MKTRVVIKDDYYLPEYNDGWKTLWLWVAFENFYGARYEFGSMERALKFLEPKLPAIVVWKSDEQKVGV